ncbi:flagellar hook-length control protein FliK [Desulfallas sp. Bu1-1]|uniref:flagellar hook-length control protein FliK n=1 Tax=Desulfallas sp. Bu1-1 TaxID=2787620 RepID=UPI00189F3677|nr:flagellar hook-length control protein FliK [Desulfallas sp. Bu1-1]MBF7081959.1 flagellar hook-length control protein FliK [Desulfallas sp. Bu1-1]
MESVPGASGDRDKTGNQSAGILNNGPLNTVGSNDSGTTAGDHTPGKASILTIPVRNPNNANIAPESQTLVTETAKNNAAKQADAVQLAMNVPDSAPGIAKTAGQEVIPTVRAGENNFTVQLARAIVEQVNQDGQGQSHVRLRLQPENLGDVIIKITYREGNISTHFQAATEHARHLIESSLFQLRETLAGMQLNLQNVSVSVGLGDKYRGQEFGQGRQFNKQRGPSPESIKINGNDIAGPSVEMSFVTGVNRLNYFV